jgi:hypothetical protein
MEWVCGYAGADTDFLYPLRNIRRVWNLPASAPRADTDARILAQQVVCLWARMLFGPVAIFNWQEFIPLF